MVICQLFRFFGEVSAVVFGWFFFLGCLSSNYWIFKVLFFSFFLYILDNCPLPGMSFANIFLQSMACFLIPLTMLYIEHKFWILMRLTLPIVSFMEHTFIVVFKKPLLYPSHLSFLLCYLPGVLLFCISYLGLWYIFLLLLFDIYFYLFGYTRSLLWRLRSLILVTAWELLVVAYGI